MIVSGILTRCDIHVGRSMWIKKPTWERYLDCAMKTDSGDVYFKTPSRCQRSLYSLDHGAEPYEPCPWFIGDDPVVKVNDYITVQGSTKTWAISKAGNPYTVLNRVKLIK